MAQTRLETLAQKLDGDKRNHTFIRFPLNLESEGTKNLMIININAISGSKYAGSQYKVVEGQDATIEEEGSGSLYQKFKGNIVRIDTTIALYMPSNIQTSYQSNWSSSELGVMGAAMEAFTSVGDMSEFSTYQQIWDTVKERAPTSLGMTGASILDSITPFNVKDAYKFGTQTVANPYVEVLFNGVSNRTFSFTFKFLPKNQAEQKEIKRIIDTLKFHRAPERMFSGLSNYWKFPSTFDIGFYKKDGSMNEWLFRISTCALTDLNVSYGGESTYQSFEDGSPLTTTMTLSFTELESLTKERHLQGF